MVKKIKFKTKAISLRRRGRTYSEILEIIPVAKSTLSLWLRSIGLAKKQKQRLTEKKMASILRGAAAKRNQRIQLSEKIKKESCAEIKLINKKELMLIGTALYWAEGSKEKEHNIGQGIIFSNSDPLMIKLFLKWLKTILGVRLGSIYPEIYIHENSKNNVDKAIKYWSNTLGIPDIKFRYIYFKKNQILTKRKNAGKNYYGLIRIGVRKSVNLNRKISGWIEGIIKKCGVV